MAISHSQGLGGTPSQSFNSSAVFDSSCGLDALHVLPFEMVLVLQDRAALQKEEGSPFSGHAC